MCSFDACAGISYPSVAWLPPLLSDVAIVVNVGVLECSSPTTGIPTCLYLYIRYPTDVCLCEDIATDDDGIRVNIHSNILLCMPFGRRLHAQAPHTLYGE